MPFTPITWPLTIKPRRQSFYLQTLSVVFTNPYTNVQQVLERDGQRWVSRLTVERGGDLAREIDALVASLRGPAGAVLLPDFRTLAARNDVSGATLTGGSGRTLTVTGGSALMPGDLIQTSPGRGHIVTAVAGDSVSIEPRLREPVTTGALVTDAVRIKMRLASDEAGRNPTRPPRRSSWDLDFVEILPEAES